MLSPRAFNELTGRYIACLIKRCDRDWSFHVAVPDGNEIGGVVVASTTIDKFLFSRLLSRGLTLAHTWTANVLVHGLETLL
jgi:hypothetical protein